MVAQGIEPFINLFHFDMPVAMQEIGGWENREVVDEMLNLPRPALNYSVIE